MRNCTKCNVQFSGDLERCPLCQARLEGEAEPALFPYNRVQKSGAIALAVLGIITGVSLLVMVLLLRFIGIPGDIVLTVCLALIVNYLFVQSFIKRSPGFLSVVARYFILLIALALIWYLITKNPVVSTLVIPSICLTALVYDTVLLAIFRGTFLTGYAKYLLMDVACGAIPLVLSYLGLTFWDLPAYIVALAAALFLLALVVFMRNELVSEVRKLFSA